MKGGLSFPFSWAPPFLLHVFSLLFIHTTTTITFEPCALNDEFQHFVLSFNKNFLKLTVEYNKIKYWEKNKTMTLLFNTLNKVLIFYKKRFEMTNFNLVKTIEHVSNRVWPWVTPWGIQLETQRPCMVFNHIFIPTQHW